MDPNLNINQLRIFHAAAEALSFTRAAQALHLTQPGVSKHIKGLEEYFSTRLFDRLGRKPALTPAGQILYEATQQIARLLEESRIKIKDLEDNQAGQLRIGASITLGIYILLPYVKRFRKRFPQIDVSMDISLSREVEAKLLGNLFDVGFLGHPAQDDRLVSAVLCRDQLVLVMPPDHAWARRTSIHIRDLDQEPMLLSQKGSGTRAILEHRFAALGIAPRFIELGHTESIKRGVEAGLGIAILSRAVVERELKMGWLHTVRLKGMNLQRDFYYAYRKDKYLSKAVREFLSMAADTARAASAGRIASDKKRATLSRASAVASGSGARSG